MLRQLLPFHRHSESKSWPRIREMEMMDFKEFQKQILQEAQDRMWGVKVCIQNVEKLQGESYTGLSVQPNDSPVAATINLDVLYGQMAEGKSFQEIADDLISHAVDIITDMPKIDVNDLTNYDQMKNTLVVQVIPTDRNEDMLANIPHEEAQEEYIASLDTEKDEPEEPEIVEPVDPEPEQPEEKPKKNNMAGILGVLAVLGIVGAGGGYYFVQQNKKKKAEVKPDPDSDYDENDGADEVEYLDDDSEDTYDDGDDPVYDSEDSDEA